MTKILLAIALVLVGPSTVRAAEFTHPTLGYSLEYPDGWKAKQAGEAGQIVEIYTGPSGSTNIVVPRDVDLNIQVLDKQRGDDDAVLDSMLIPDSERRGERKNVDRGGRHYRELVAQSAASFQSDGTPNYYLQRYVVTTIAGVRFLFICDAWDDSEGISEQKRCDQIIDSVTIHGGNQNEVQQ